MQKLKELVELAKAYQYDPCSITYLALARACEPETVAAIAKAFQVLELENIKLKQGCENSPLAHEMVDWRERAEAAEARLVELEKQEPSFHVRLIRTEQGPAWIECGADYHRGRHFFTRPVPAANLAELVPPEMTNPHQLAAEGTGWNDCRAAILRNIEEAK